MNLENVDLSGSMHFMVRHWHGATADGKPIGMADMEIYSVLVAGYIVPKDRENTNAGYTVYARAYRGEYLDDLNNFVEVTKATDSNYIGIGTDGDENGKVIMKAAPYNDGNGKYYECFAGFSIVTGQTAATYNQTDESDQYYADVTLVIDPAVAGNSVRLVKSHAYYASEVATVNGSANVRYGNGDTDSYPPMWMPCPGPPRT